MATTWNRLAMSSVTLCSQLAFACMMVSLSLRAACGQENNDYKEVRNLLDEHTYFFDGGGRKLFAMNEKAFPAYDHILASRLPRSDIDVRMRDGQRIGCLFRALSKYNNPPTRFLEHAVTLLSENEPFSMTGAINYIGQFGSSTDTAPVIALYRHEDSSTTFLSMYTLSAIGGPRDLHAIDLCYRGVSRVSRVTRETLVTYQHITTRAVERLRQRLDSYQSPPPPPFSHTDLVAPIDVAAVRVILDAFDDGGRERLLTLRTAARSALERLLTDPATNPLTVARIFAALANDGHQRGSYLDAAVQRLADDRAEIRWAAVQFLKVAGTIRESSVLIAMLHDHSPEVVRAAADALVQRGNQRTLIALDVWFNGTAHKENQDLRRYVKASRDALMARLNPAP